MLMLMLIHAHVHAPPLVTLSNVFPVFPVCPVFLSAASPTLFRRQSTKPASLLFPPPRQATGGLIFSRITLGCVA
ncbi:hypothetical protein LY78DRAFT_371623 [Colletotrichum sublineola]|nr:hypothetical protein LY78DRAFT_371623 [Colletotrichum sublineola]